LSNVLCVRTSVSEQASVVRVRVSRNAVMKTFRDMPHGDREFSYLRQNNQMVRLSDVRVQEV
jgi:hypothetical protein